MLSTQELIEILHRLPQQIPAPCIDKADFTDTDYEDIEDYVLTWSKPGTLKIVQLSLSCRERESNQIAIKGIYADSTHCHPPNMFDYLNKKLKELYESE
jgi:hypothetical protein